MNKSKVNIMVTKKYGIFNTQKGNRDVKGQDIRKIEGKIMEDNLLRYHPILVNLDFEVIDGQHRLEVAKANNLEISYIIMDGKKELKTTQLINTTGKPWNVKDFLNSYVSQGVVEYVAFQSYLDEHKFLTISQFMAIYNLSTNPTVVLVDKFKDGLLNSGSNHLTIRAILRVLAKYTCVNLSKFTHFQRFITSSTKKNIKFDHDRMIKRIKLNMDIVKALPQDYAMIADILGEIYNHGLANQNRVNFSVRKIK